MKSRNSSSGISRCSILALVSLFCGTATAQYQNAGTINYKYSEKIDQSTNISPLGDDLFGDSTNFENGATTFLVVDAAAPTNIRLPVRLGRNLNIRGGSGWSPSAQMNHYPEKFNIFGGQWEADLPYIQNDSLADFGWVADNGAGRCTSGRFSKSATNVSEIVVPAHNFFFGNDINIPSYGRERLLALLPGAVVPSDASTYVGTTRSNWKISCLPAIKNGSGEGFVVTLPDGAKYYFDWMASADTGYMNTSRGTLYTRRFRLYATKATDRFGGFVDYIYDTTYPERVKRIQSSDGAAIDINYAQPAGPISSVNIGSRTWQYSTQGQNLTVTLPDNSTFTYNNGTASVDAKLGLQMCEVTVGTRSSSQPPGPNDTQTLQIKHPSGATGTFLFRPIMFGYNRTPLFCQSGSYQPKAYIGNALYAKSISGPGILTKSWDIKYYPSWSYVSECAGCATTASTVVTENASTITTYVFGNDHSTNAGQLLSKTISGGGISSSEIYTYLTTAAGQPFPDAIGEDPYQIVSNAFLLKNRPRKSTTIVQDGREFRNIVEAYDSFARPTKIVKTSRPVQ